MSPKFEVTMGGYDIKEVDRLVALVEDNRKDVTAEDRRTLLEVLRSWQATEFPRKFRGYSKIQVHNYIDDRLRELSPEAGSDQAP
jgi:cell division septum initiation protein DivIVA